MKNAVWIVLFVVVVAVFIGIGVVRKGGSGSANARTIGVIPKETASQYWKGVKNGAEQAAKEENVTILWNGPEVETDNERQIQIVEDMIAQKVDGIILVPLSPGPAQALVDQAAAANIPIGTAHGYVGADRTAENPYAKLKFVITEDEIGAGATAGDMAVKALSGGGKVAVITGAAGFIENTNRVTKFKAALDAKGGYTIVATQPGNWTKQDGQSACQNILAATPDVGLFYAISDDMAVGCAAAVKSAGSKAKIIGIGGSATGIAAIKSGEVYGTVCYKPEDEGASAVQAMYDVLTGKLTGAPKTNFYDTPGVTKDNVDSCTPQW